MDHRQDTTAGAEGDDRIDAAGWWQLVGLAVLGAGVPLGWALLDRDGTAPWTAAVVVAVGLVVVLPMTQVSSWSRRGGRAAVRTTRRWVRSGAVPADVPEQVWQPRLQRYEDDLDKRRYRAWAGILLVVLWSALALSGSAGHWILVGFWAVMTIADFVRVRRDAPAVRRLLAASDRERPAVGTSSMGA